jgi:hypothetical protein
MSSEVQCRCCWMATSICAQHYRCQFRRIRPRSRRPSRPQRAPAGVEHRGSELKALSASVGWSAVRHSGVQVGACLADGHSVTVRRGVLSKSALKNIATSRRWTRSAAHLHNISPATAPSLGDTPRCLCNTPPHVELQPKPHLP